MSSVQHQTLNGVTLTCQCWWDSSKMLILPSCPDPLRASVRVYRVSSNKLDKWNSTIYVNVLLRKHWFWQKTNTALTSTRSSAIIEQNGPENCCLLQFWICFPVGKMSTCFLWWRLNVWMSARHTLHLQSDLDECWVVVYLLNKHLK